MQPIQDKDFDQLFKNAFEDAEITPSRDLWSSIESEIEPKRKRIFPIYWLSAAAVILITAVGLLVYQQQEKPKQFASRLELKVTKPVVETKALQDSSTVVTTQEKEIKQVLPTIAQPSIAIAKTKVKETFKPGEEKKIVTAPEMQKQEVVLAKNEPAKQDLKEKIDEAILEQEKPILASNAAAVKADEVAGGDDQADNRGIRNVGDVVNLIVNKVDKRKDKFIQFRTDDDDSSISAINIGPFKFGKKKK